MRPIPRRRRPQSAPAAALTAAWDGTRSTNPATRSSWPALLTGP